MCAITTCVSSGGDHAVAWACANLRFTVNSDRHRPRGRPARREVHPCSARGSLRRMNVRAETSIDAEDLPVLWRALNMSGIELPNESVAVWFHAPSYAGGLAVESRM